MNAVVQSELIERTTWAVKAIGQVDYMTTYAEMRSFTDQRNATTDDEIWLVEHSPVFTQGQAGKPEHVLAPGAIPIVQTDRGGQVTYHGPGQVVAYIMFDLKRAGFFVKEFVYRIEQAVIDTLQECGVTEAQRKPGAPGIYVPYKDSWDSVAKIAALGLKVRNGCTYHGVSLNVDMDLTPFALINPCGYAGLVTTDMAHQGVKLSLEVVSQRLAQHIMQQLEHK